MTSFLSQNYYNHETNYLNTSLKKSNLEVKQELQPEFNFSLKRTPVRWKVKPKLKYKYAQYIYDDPQPGFQNRNETKTKNLSISEYGFWENYLSVEPISNLEISVGIINRQWGSSELVNPSQIFFTQQVLNLEPFQYTQGLELVELLWTPTQNLSINFLSELKPFEWDHSDELSYGKRDYQNRYLLRAEYANSSGNLLIGQVVSSKKTDRTRWNYGGYGFWSYTDWTQIYFDFMTQKGSELYFVDESSNLVQPYIESEYLFSLAVLGHRLTLEMGLEWKIEYVMNSFAKSAEDRDLEIKLLKVNPYNTAALAAFYQGRYILPASSLLYNSFRWDDPGLLKRLFTSSTIFLRFLNSLSDQSGFAQLEFQSSLSDSWTQGVSLVKSYGEEMKELNSELDYLAVYSLRRAF